MFAALKEMGLPTYGPIATGSGLEQAFEANFARSARLVALGCMAPLTGCCCRLSFAAAGAVSIYLASKSDQLSDQAKIGVYVAGGLTILGGLCGFGCGVKKTESAQTKTTQQPMNGRSAFHSDVEAEMGGLGVL